MGERQWFIRFAGERSGPFDVERLRTLAHRGQLTRMHSVSTDGRTWAPATSLREVFGADGTIVSHVSPDTGTVSADDDNPFGDLPDLPDQVLELPPAVPFRAPLGSARVRPVVLCALGMATVMLCLPTSRDEAGHLGWWWSEGPLSISLRGLGAAATLCGWFVAVLAPEPARGAAVAGVAALLSATAAACLATWAPWAAFLAPLVPMSAILVALDSACAPSLRTAGRIMAVGSILVGLAAVVMVVLNLSGWSIAAGALGLAASAAMAWSGFESGRTRGQPSGRVFWGCIVGATGAMASLFATAFAGLSQDVPMRGAEAATAASLVLSFAAVSWAAVHETLESSHLLPRGESSPDDAASP